MINERLERALMMANEILVKNKMMKLNKIKNKNKKYVEVEAEDEQVVDNEQVRGMVQNKG